MPENLDNLEKILIKTGKTNFCLKQKKIVITNINTYFKFLFYIIIVM